MISEDYSDAALVLVGHGSTKNTSSEATVYQHAAALRARNLFATVREAFWKQDPGVADVLRSIAARRVFVIPLFISEGYFSEVIIPRDLGFRGGGEGEFCRVQERGAQTWFYGLPVGTHDRMTEVLIDRARAITRQFPFPRAPREQEVTLFIAGHGTGQNEDSRKSIERQVELLRSAGVYNAVHAIFMEEEPRIERCYELAKTTNIVVVPFFISDGLHVQEDIPVLLGEAEALVKQRVANRQPPWRNPTEKRDHRVWYTPCAGSDPVMAEVILARVREAAQWA